MIVFKLSKQNQYNSTERKNVRTYSIPITYHSFTAIKDTN